MTEKPTHTTLTTKYIYRLTPNAMTIGIPTGRTITRVNLKINRDVYRALLRKMQEPIFSLYLPLTLHISHTFENPEVVYQVDFAKIIREPKTDDNHK